MALSPADLQHLSTRTLADYQAVAEAFRDGTAGHDVSQNIDALLRYLPAEKAVILDFGCGPGRDLSALKARGHSPVGLDGCAAFVAMAREASGCEVWEQNFLGLALPAEHFDGVFANASLFHVPSQELPRVLAELHATLKPGGVLFSSNPRGEGQEGFKGQRYGAFHSIEQWRQVMQAAGFQELEHYYRPAGLPREQQPWLASAWRKG
ncbi:MULTISPECIES: bifunctional 2-polyprenyl-6-hydroxyphenol methylase/3-demethylubiquinol 3-O-methyltransferase UbiG [unclassified Pseudomonas]|uniref:class I SAM-dependent methyltransferase n=1 Tax=unclassified Pseudomonas TaxID=196821 RepID=UPI000BC92832|nr:MULTISPECIES: class I SAM-dependent methyltransferase [unclassified Pseudomonas]PVZ15386.1 methyltransferase family protein [Pseudomonas sp. URIL14HWK12:I12]PVZ24760.1 methyltransferase family protein [Pseudomonas sp. URIL14HWK12:I10]PVZ34606.1 methyltransferase family protein [Pseudomonas sp. URIL14HWK12:I11]SNZ08771.1 Methylase involved in ubiquinone/menaquinone biosynthesis [Pseudomonas sp. URIL14HWK12:I9]